MLENSTQIHRRLGRGRKGGVDKLSLSYGHSCIDVCRSLSQLAA